VKNFVKEVFKDERPLAMLIIRDSNYDKQINFHTGGVHARYRDSAIQTYVEGIEYLVDAGFTVIKMGKEGGCVSKFENFRFFDLSQMGGDIVEEVQLEIASRASLAISTDTGAIHLATIFRKPIYCLNFAQTNLGLRSKLFRLLMLKTFLHQTSKNRVRFMEMEAKGLLGFTDFSQFNDAGITLIDNTSTEIRQFMEEVVQDFYGVWAPSPESMALRVCLKSMVDTEGLEDTFPYLPNFWSKKAVDFI